MRSDGILPLASPNEPLQSVEAVDPVAKAWDKGAVEAALSSVELY